MNFIEFIICVFHERVAQCPEIFEKDLAVENFGGGALLEKIGN